MLVDEVDDWFASLDPATAELVTAAIDQPSRKGLLSRVR
jgi:hypothetical protein